MDYWGWFASNRPERIVWDVVFNSSLVELFYERGAAWLGIWTEKWFEGQQGWREENSIDAKRFVQFENCLCDPVTMDPSQQNCSLSCQVLLLPKWSITMDGRYGKSFVTGNILIYVFSGLLVSVLWVANNQNQVRSFLRYPKRPTSVEWRRNSCVFNLLPPTKADQRHHNELNHQYVQMFWPHLSSVIFSGAPRVAPADQFVASEHFQGFAGHRPSADGRRSSFRWRSTLGFVFDPSSDAICCGLMTDSEGALAPIQQLVLVCLGTKTMSEAIVSVAAEPRTLRALNQGSIELAAGGLFHHCGPHALRWSMVDWGDFRASAPIQFWSKKPMA